MFKQNECRLNFEIAKERFSVENYFGLMQKLWNITKDTFNWKEHDYDIYIQCCVALINFHVLLHPLRQEDGKAYQRWLKSIYQNALEKEETRNAQKEQYSTKYNPGLVRPPPTGTKNGIGSKYQRGLNEVICSSEQLT